MDFTDPVDGGRGVSPAQEPPEQIRVLVVDDHEVVAEGLVLLLEANPAVTVVGTATTVEMATRLATDLHPDVILTDYHLPDGTAADAARKIRQRHEDAAIVIITGGSTDEAFKEAVDAGACGFLSKTQSGAEIVEAVLRAAAGEFLIPPSELIRLLADVRKRNGLEPAAGLVEPLTPREREVVALMSNGLDNNAIADRLTVSYTTVRSHVRKILEKLEAHSKLEAVARAREYGLLDD